ncbi:tRNA preQ1(34) S-adenosylmethionine ribosyltransferase-isomerase QueA [Lacihabitans sp. CCS-44]|uniref:tRNA preQ1(34) S-adenosylmethionine ribosyltransferase-isomerase QueA n=1 Tax=Lacihabitans sp. CCS-44 TaxID=2487331 RepID=UPI0020CDDEBD|nr:tRNA preQ1(34) S-adenosylmethionine ribosyltransferase-isomerase QueA [Lacihabitans sp. CCS-44]MCP9757607.1 tRNA preQ1(34) S-adenosylmethionine ribosyltransferase-isomerase QueA [Lacihabitans sp. CCS-44]
MQVKISDYTYELNDERIAKYPAEPRDSSKLLFYNREKIAHSRFTDIVDLLPENTHLVLNNTKVIPARMFFKRETGAVIEVFLLNPISPSNVISLAMEANYESVWECVIGNKKKWKTDEILNSEVEINNRNVEINASFADREQKEVKISWNSEDNFSDLVEAFGKIPLPPYLNRDSEETDIENYQTVYSKNKGAVAAPTAGLHFTDAVFEKISNKGIQKSFLTLHVGAGTFMPVKTENALEHPMHNEQLVFSREFVETLIENHSFVVPVGTTSMRSLESLYWFGVKLIENPKSNFFIEKLFPYEERTEISTLDALKTVLSYFVMNDLKEIIGQTEIMIFPSYKFKICKGLITNFHQPSSTLLMLVAAFVGENNWKKIYTEALNNDYRFLSFGDSSLLIP